MAELYKKPDDVTSVFRGLNAKFSENLNLAFQSSTEIVCTVELKARSIDAVGRILSQIDTITHTQAEIVSIFNELFADIISSLYLAACALDKPAQIILRRVLELGVAIVYLWDLPHKFWGWKQHAQDLNFSEMLDHLGSPQYTSFISSANTAFSGPQVLKIADAKKIYGSLSDTVHGKISTLESVLPNRFKYSKEDWELHLSLVNTVEDMLLYLFQNRFKEVSSNIHEQFPQIARTH
jgi:hypothetical protein